MSHTVPPLPDEASARGVHGAGKPRRSGQAGGSGSAGRRRWAGRLAALVLLCLAATAGALGLQANLAGVRKALAAHAPDFVWAARCAPALGLGRESPVLSGYLALLPESRRPVARAAPEPVLLHWPIGPYPPDVLSETVLARWKFDNPNQAWRTVQQARTRVAHGALQIETTGISAVVEIPADGFRAPLAIRWRMRSTSPGPCIFYSPLGRHGQDARVNSLNDGAWHEYRAVFMDPPELCPLFLCPITDPGTVEFADVTITHLNLHPLQVDRLEADDAHLRGTVQNVSDRIRTFEVGGRSYTAAPGKSVAFEMDVPGRRAFEAVTVAITSAGLPTVRRSVYLHHPRLPLDAVRLDSGRVQMDVARDGSGARLYRAGELVGVLAPLAQMGTAPVPLTCAPRGREVELHGGPVERLTVGVDGDEIRLQMHARTEVIGPAVRLRGNLEQGLLAGVEYLGKNEESSSRRDIERPEYRRYEPDPLLLTMPLAAFVTEHASAALMWDDPQLRPIFATPNRYDGTAEHRAALRGRDLTARLRLAEGFSDGGRLEEAILWAVRKRGLPAPPPRPRSRAAQQALCLRGLTESLRAPRGWFSRGDRPDWPARQAHYYADFVSAIWELTGKVPAVPDLSSGGGSISDDAAYLLTGRGRQWRDRLAARAEAILQEQGSDGSFRYAGPMGRGHFEDTASGYCAERAALLLEHAWYTGNARSRTAGARTLEFMKRFRTPRGAQLWEMPLHAPDLTASSWLVRAYVRGYELTGRTEYLALARALGHRRLALHLPVEPLPHHALWDGAGHRGDALERRLLDRLAGPVVRPAVCLCPAAPGAAGPHAGLAACGGRHPGHGRADAVPRWT